jgi:hypothetical protein
MTRISLDPTRLRDYVAHASAPRDDADQRVMALTNALADLEAALPSWLGGPAPPAAPDAAGALQRVATLDDHVGAVAAVFEDADEHGPDGLPVVDDGTLTATAPLPALYDEDDRQALRDRAEDELATLFERLRAGDADATTAGELAAVLGLLDHVVAASADPQQAAAGLMERMGAGDLDAALTLLEEEAAAADDVGRRDWQVVAIADLASFVSLGLEAEPARAARWVDRLASRRDLAGPDGADGADGLAVLGAFVAPGTQVLGRHLFARLWRVGPAPGGGLVERLYDTDVLVEPVLAGAGRNPELANAIVTDLLGSGEVVDAQGRTRADDFEVLFSISHEQDPRFSGLDDGVLGDALAAAVDPSLDPLDRATTAWDLTNHYVDVELDGRVHYGYPPEVLHGLAAATQPLLEGWDPAADGQVVLATRTDAATPVDDGPLWRAVADYAQRDGGLAGLREAVGGATVFRVDAAGQAIVDHPGQADAIGGPLRTSDLRTLGDLYLEMGDTLADRRLADLASAVTPHGDAGAALWTVASGVAGEFPGGSTVAAMADAARGYYADPPPGTGDALAGVSPQLATNLVEANLLARPGQFDSEVVRELLPAAMAYGGRDAVFSLVVSNDPLAGAPADLRGLVERAQSDPAYVALRNQVGGQLDAVDAQWGEALSDTGG